MIRAEDAIIETPRRMGCSSGCPFLTPLCDIFWGFKMVLLFSSRHIFYICNAISCVYTTALNHYITRDSARLMQATSVNVQHWPSGSVCYRYAKYVLAGLISATGPDTNPGRDAKLCQANPGTYAVGFISWAFNCYQAV